MKFSIWNQYFQYSYSSSMNKEEVLSRLETFFSEKKPKAIFIRGNNLTIEKGSLFASFFCIGPETWCKNIINIEVKEIPEGSHIQFDINLKLPGFTFGRNFLLEEAAEACKYI